MDRPGSNSINVAAPGNINVALRDSSTRLKLLYSRSARVLAHDIKHAPVPPPVQEMLVQIEAKSVWIDGFHSFIAAVAEYLKKRATLPVTSISLADELETSAICNIAAQALDMLPFPASSIVMAALYVLAEAEDIAVSMLQCGSRPCLNVYKVKGSKKQSAHVSKRGAVASSGPGLQPGSAVAKAATARPPPPPWHDGGYIDRTSMASRHARAYAHHNGPKQEFASGRFLNKHG